MYSYLYTLKCIKFGRNGTVKAKLNVAPTLLAILKYAERAVSLGIWNLIDFFAMSMQFFF